MSTELRLDDLYKMIAHIYSEQNAHRSPSATFLHFVEVCGMLATHSRNKKREDLTFVDAFCKALGWFFPLMAKFRVFSVEELIFRKYPHACPYCRLARHEDDVCKTMRGTAKTVDHAALRQVRANAAARPVRLADWQLMFKNIYPRSMDDARAARSTLGLLEELGELAEAIRVFDRYPKYFAGEAADVFSYLMGMANERALDPNSEQFSLEDELIKRYPGLCVQCGHSVCVCPLVPEATVGRMAKELEIEGGEQLFRLDHDAFGREALEISAHVLDRVGGYAGLVEKFPFDRGDANKALVLLCLRLADAVSETDSVIAESLRSSAIKIGASATYAGSRRPQGQLENVVASVRKIIEGIPEQVRVETGTSGQSLEKSVGLMAMPKIKVLVVFANPRGTAQLKLQQEERVIREAVRGGKARDSISLDTRHATTVDDLRRALLDDGYQVLHFSGHGDFDALLFENEQGKKLDSPLDAIAALVRHHPSIKCVILSACNSTAALNAPIAEITIGMDNPVDDSAAIEFSRGFYDAIAAGKSYDDAINEGEIACQLKSLELPLKVLRA